MAFEAGAKVRVVRVPDTETDYVGLVGKCGVVEGEPWRDSAGEWVFVRLDGERAAIEFKVNELEPVANVTVIEGYLTGGFDNTFHLDETSVTDALTEALRHKKPGMKHRFTIEEVPT